MLMKSHPACAHTASAWALTQRCTNTDISIEDDDVLDFLKTLNIAWHLQQYGLMEKLMNILAIVIFFWLLWPRRMEYVKVVRAAYSLDKSLLSSQVQLLARNCWTGQSVIADVVRTHGSWRYQDHSWRHFSLWKDERNTHADGTLDSAYMVSNRDSVVSTTFCLPCMAKRTYRGLISLDVCPAHLLPAPLGSKEVCEQLRQHRQLQSQTCKISFKSLDAFQNQLPVSGESHAWFPGAKKV